MVYLSIIIPHYNNPFKLERLLDSIGEHENVEIIVVDDKSSKYIDDLNCLVENRNIKFYTNEGKNSAGTCRNIGLYNAIGKWILFADADDFFMKNWYEKIEIYFNSSYDLVYFFPTSWDDSNNKEGMRHLPYIQLLSEYNRNQNSLTSVRLKAFFSVPWSKMIRRQLCIQNNIFFDSTMYSNDVMFSKKVGQLCKRFTIDEKRIYCVTENQSSLTKVDTPISWFIRFKVNCDVIKYSMENYTEEEYFLTKIWGIPLQSLVSIIKRRYGFNYLQKCIRYYKDKNIPILNLKIIKYSVKIFVRNFKEENR